MTEDARGRYLLPSMHEPTTLSKRIPSASLRAGRLVAPCALLALQNEGAHLAPPRGAAARLRVPWALGGMLVALFAAPGFLLSLGCAPQPLPPPPPSASGMASATLAPRGPGWSLSSWGIFHSKRFPLALALPEGHSWKIDDHHDPWLVATHPPTHSIVRARILYFDDPVSPARCEEQLRLIDPASIEGRVSIPLPHWPDWSEEGGALIQGSQALNRATSVHGWIVAAAIRRCVVVTFDSSDDAPDANTVLGERLADWASAILPRLRVEAPLDFHIPMQPLPTSLEPPALGH